MDERRKTLAAITVLVGLIVFVIVVIGAVMSSRQVLSPVPSQDTIRIIFVSPTPTRVTPTDTQKRE